jgi:hypothetical protein
MSNTVKDREAVSQFLPDLLNLVKPRLGNTVFFARKLSEQDI